tara:strand:+ start:18 stop:677 length:660 start_codon:yes stop_codon:yes gene_type:complete
MLNMTPKKKPTSRQRSKTITAAGLQAARGDAKLPVETEMKRRNSLSGEPSSSESHLHEDGPIGADVDEEDDYDGSMLRASKSLSAIPLVTSDSTTATPIVNSDTMTTPIATPVRKNPPLSGLLACGKAEIHSAPELSIASENLQAGVKQQEGKALESPSEKPLQNSEYDIHYSIALLKTFGERSPKICRLIPVFGGFPFSLRDHNVTAEGVEAAFRYVI